MEDKRNRLTTKALVYDDLDTDEIEIKIVWKEGKTSKDCSPFVMERVLLNHMFRSWPTWWEYWMKPGSTLG